VYPIGVYPAGVPLMYPAGVPLMYPAGVSRCMYPAVCTPLYVPGLVYSARAIPGLVYSARAIPGFGRMCPVLYPGLGECVPF